MHILALLLVFAGSTWRVGDTAKTGSMPWGVTVSADGTQLWVAHVGQKDRDTVRRYDAATLAVKARAKFRGHAVETVPSADGKTLYVTNSRKHEIVALDATTLAVTGRHATGKIPKDLRRHRELLYIADYGGNTLSIVDLATGRRESVRVGKRPRGVAVSPDGATVYVANMGSRTVSIVDAKSRAVTRTVKTCASPRHVAVTDAGLVLVTCLGARHVDVLDADGDRQRRLTVGRGPKTIAVTRDQKVAITADERGDSVTLIDLQTWETKTIDVPIDQPCGLAIAPSDDRVYLTGRGSDELLVIVRE